MPKPEPKPNPFVPKNNFTFTPKNDTRQTRKKPNLPVILKLDKISRSGLINIKFNQKLKIPTRFRQQPKRLLRSLASEDDIFVISIGSRDGERTDFDHSIVGWTADDVSL